MVGTQKKYRCVLFDSVSSCFYFSHRKRHSSKRIHKISEIVNYEGQKKSFREKT